MSKIVVCYFSYHKDIDFLNESLKYLQKTIERHPEHEVRVYVFDDGHCDKNIKKKELETSPTLITTHFNRNGNLNGFECIHGMFVEYAKIAQHFDYDYLIKLDSDCVLNTFDYIVAIENRLKKENLLDKLGQIGSYFAQLCCYGCCQTFTKLGVSVILNLCNHMAKGESEEARIMKKRVDAGWNEDKVVSVLMEMCPVLRASIDVLEGIKGHVNAFEQPILDWSEWTSVAFKPNRVIPNKWSKEYSLDQMKKYCNSLMSNMVAPCFVPHSRFGNHLFTFAAAYAHAKRNGYEFCYSESPFIDKVINNEFKKDTSDISELYKEPTYHYTQIPKDVTGKIMGFYQSSKYFADYADDIRSLYSLLWLGVEKNYNKAAIHIRMGNYLFNEWRFRSPKKEYIENALSLLSDEITTIEIFSDEPDKAKELIMSCDNSKQFVIIVNDKVDEIETIRDMISSTEFIGSCSSFSWWAAYLGNFKKTIFDKKWYNDDTLITKDIYEEDWTII